MAHERSTLIMDVAVGDRLDIRCPVIPDGPVTVELVRKSGGRARLLIRASREVSIDHVEVEERAPRHVRG